MHSTHVLTTAAHRGPPRPGRGPEVLAGRSAAHTIDRGPPPLALKGGPRSWAAVDAGLGMDAGRGAYHQKRRTAARSWAAVERRLRP